MTKYKIGQHVYILASNCMVQEVVVRGENDHIYTLKLEQAGMIQLPEERIYARRETAEELIRQLRRERDHRPSYLEKLAHGML